MIKKSFVFALFLVMVFSVSAFAGEGSDTIGNCRLQPELRYTYVQNHLRSESFFLRGVMNGEKSDWWNTGHRAYLQLTYGAGDYVDIYGLVGASISGRTTGENPTDTVHMESNLGTNFLWGLGVKATFFRADNGFYVGAGASLTYVYTHDDRFFERNEVLFPFPFKADTLQLKGDLHAGWHIGDTGLTPYVGIEYNWTKANVELHGLFPLDTTLDIAFHEDYPLGVYVGLDYLLNDKLYFNLEGNMVNRWGGSFSVGYRFDLCGKPAPIAPPPPPPPPVIEPKLEPMTKN
jgi:hypothetical protein